MQINWALFETEARQLYSSEGRTAEDTVKYLNNRHNLQITVQQFKAKYGGSKEGASSQHSNPTPEPRDGDQTAGQPPSIITAEGAEDIVTSRIPAHQASPIPAETSMSDFVDLGGEDFDLVKPGGIPSGLSTPELINRNDCGVDPTLCPTNGIVTNENQAIVLSSPGDVVLLRNSPVMLSSATAGIGGSSAPSWEVPETPGSNLAHNTTLGPDSDTIKRLLGQVSVAAPGGQANWLASQARCVRSTPPNPIAADLLNRIFSHERAPSGSQFSSTLLPFVDQIFLPVAHLISNGLLMPMKVSEFISWVFRCDLAQRLFKFLQKNHSRMEHFITQTLFAIVDLAMSNERLLCGGHHKFGKHRLDILKLIELVDSRAIPSFLGAMLLSYFAQHEDLEAARLLVSRGARTDLCFHKQNLRLTIHYNLGRTPLIAAVRGGSLDMLRYLIDVSAPIDGSSLFRIEGDDASPLAEAVERKEIKMVKILLDNGAEVAYDMKVNRRYILPYAKSESPEIYPLLIESLENKATLDTMTIMVLMGEKAERGSRDLSNFLADHKIDRDDLLEGALWHAIETDNLRAMVTLLDRGVDPNAVHYRRARHTQQCDEFPEASGEHVFSQGEDFESSHPFAIAFSTDETTVLEGIAYFLQKAGIEVNDEVLSRICRKAYRRIYHMPILFSMAQAGYHRHVFGPCALEHAAHEGNILQCGLLLDSGIDVNAYAISSNMTALQAAAKAGHLATVEFLIRRGADVDSLARENPLIDHGRPLDCERLNFTPLQAAAFHGHVDVVSCLVAAGADVKLPPAKGNGIGLLEASAGGLALDKAFRAPRPSDTDELVREEESFKMLLALGTPVNGPMGTSGSLLHALIRARKVDCLELVLKAGATTEDRDFRENQNRLSMRRQARVLHGTTPIQLAAYHQQKEAIELLMRYGADINAPAADVKWGRTALQAAVGDHVIVGGRVPPPPKTNTEILEFLLQHGANVNAPPGKCFGRTALQATTDIIPVDPIIVMFLLQHGADINAPPAEEGGVTVLQGVAIRGDLELATTLIALGADVNAPGSAAKGRTAIEGAADYGRMDMVQLLLEKGALPSPVDGFARAIGFARAQERFDIADLLREKEEALGFMRSTGPD